MLLGRDMLQKEETSVELKFYSAHGLVNLAMEGEENWTLNCISYCAALQLVVRRILYCFILWITVYFSLLGCSCCRNIKYKSGLYPVILVVVTGKTKVLLIDLLLG